MKAGRVCELCDGEAALYCSSDSAFLCWNCDAKVHDANFLVARHVRRTLCSVCKSITGNRISGAGFSALHRICRSCSHQSPADDLDCLSSSSSSACISIAESCSAPPKKIHFDRLQIHKSVTSASTSNFPAMFSGKETSMESKAEGILENWCRKLGLGGNFSVVAMKGLSVLSSSELRILPLRVRLAASMRLSLRLCWDKSASTWQALKRLEEISGVPAKLIVAAESKLARVLSKRRSPSHQPEEGWAESSV